MSVVTDHEHVFEAVIWRRRQAEDGEMADESGRDRITPASGRSTGGADGHILERKHKSMWTGKWKKIFLEKNVFEFSNENRCSKSGMKSIQL